jgi:hypothetical protein
MQLKELAKSFYRFFREKKNVFLNLRKVKLIADAPSCFPEKKLKSRDVILKENRAWVRKYRELNSFYRLYGLDVEGSSEQDFIDYRSFMESRNVVNRIGQLDSQVVLLRDKFLFYKYMSSFNMPVPEVFAVFFDGKLYDTSMNLKDLSSLENETDYFVKEVDGECASFVKRVPDFQSFNKMLPQIQKGKFILQRKMVQCAKMAQINPNAINTLRIVTINKNGNVSVLTSLLRIGTSQTGHVDNWAAGGIAIGIDDDAHLKEFGFYKPKYGTKTDIHPDTKIVFKEFEVPMYADALNLVCSAHKFFYNVRAIGWDVAISENGPVIIEGNDNWEISLQQACDKPLKKLWLQSVAD